MRHLLLSLGVLFFASGAGLLSQSSQKAAVVYNPTTIGSGAVTAANTATPITVSSAAVAAGDYIAVELTAGTITSVAVNLQVEMH